MQISTRTGRLVSLIPILWAALFLRTHDLGRLSLWYDEADSVINARADLSWTLAHVLDDVVHPPLFFVLQKVNDLAVGETEFGARWMAAALGVLGVAGMHRLGKRWFGSMAGWLAAAWLALAPFAIWHSREVRMYSLLILLTTAAFYWFERLLTCWTPQSAGLGKGNWLNLEAGMFCLMSAALYLTHYFGLFAPLIQFAYLVINLRRHPGFLLRWTAYQALAGLPVAVWLYFQFKYGVVLRIGWIQPPTVQSVLETWQAYTLGGTQVWQWVLGLIVAVLAVIGWWRSSNRVRWLLVLWLAVPVAVTLALSTRRPMFVDRYLIGSMVPTLLAGAAGLSLTIKRNVYVGWGTAILLGGALLWQIAVKPDYFSEDWRGAMQYIADQQAPTDSLLRRSVYYLAVDYYYHGELPVESMDKGWEVPTTQPAQGRLWYVLQTGVAGSDTNRQLILNDLYSQAPSLEAQTWLKSLEPNLRHVQVFSGVSILQYDFSQP